MRTAREFCRVNTPLLPFAKAVFRAESAGTHRQPDPKTAMAADAFEAANAQQAGSSATGQPQLTRYAWYVILLLATVNAFNYMDRMALAVLAPAIKADLQLSDAQLGLLTGLAFALFYAICGIPIARWADRGNRRNIIALALATWSVMTALSGTAQHFWHLFLVRMGIGVGEAGGLTPAQSMICDYVPPKQRSGMLAIHGFGLIVGMALGIPLSSWLGDAIGWRWTFVALGLPGIALAAVVRFTLREPARGCLDATQDDRTRESLRGTLAVLWRCRTYQLLLLSMIVGGFVSMGFFQWLPSFYARTLGLSLSSVGGSLGLAIGLGSGIGAIVGGVLANKVSQRDIGLPLHLSAMAIPFALPAAVGALFVSSVVSSVLLLWLTVMLLSLPGGTVLASLYSVTIPRMRATAGAISIFGTSVVGFGLGPLCVGLLSDILEPSLGTGALRYALLAPIGLVPVLAILYYAAGKTLPRDLRAADRQIAGSVGA